MIINRVITAAHYCRQKSGGNLKLGKLKFVTS